MKKALDFRQKCGTIVVPIILRPCGWDKSEIASLLALPKDGIPVDRWQSRDEAFLDIVNGISNIVEAASTRLREGYLDEITRIEFISQNKNSIRIDDLFVFPHIIRMRDESDTPIDDLEGMLNVGNHIILRGADRSGKTTICRKLFIDNADQGAPIIMISGNELTSSLRHEELVSRKYVEQFTGSFDRWKRMQNKILIIDDFGPMSHIGFVVFAKEFFHSIVVTLSDDDYLSFFRDEKEFANFSVLSLYPMKHTQQEELIRKWKGLSSDDHSASGVSDGTIDQLENRLNGIILHHKIVPRFPFFVLSILQTYEAFMPQGLQISAYGHCYQALITAQMIRGGIRGDDIDSAFNFLGHVAFHLFLTRRERESRSFDEFVKEYRSRFVILPNVVNRLVDPAGGLLRRNGLECDFQYPFVFYYFLGYYFGTHQDECNEYIEKLVEKSYLRDNAYILIFSIHHTHDGLIGRILEHTMSAFGEVGVAHMHTAEMKVLETALFGSQKMSCPAVPWIRRERRRERGVIKPSCRIQAMQRMTTKS